MPYLNLYSLLFCCFVIAVVFCIMFFHMLKFRKAKQNNFHSSFTVELIWFFVPILILIVLLLPIVQSFVFKIGAEIM